LEEKWEGGIGGWAVMEYSAEGEVRQRQAWKKAMEIKGSLTTKLKLPASRIDAQLTACKRLYSANNPNEE